MLNAVEYELLDECKCGPEEFFGLVSSFYPGPEEQIQSFLNALARLLDRRLLTCDPPLDASDKASYIEQLRGYVNTRRVAGESLDEHPEVVAELSFTATDFGLLALRPEDRPA
jgi:hypothetical protein